MEQQRSLQSHHNTDVHHQPSMDIERENAALHGHSTESHSEDEKEDEPHKVELIPWLDKPLLSSDSKGTTFAQRHEASSIELFFDLFFVANLSTFTTYHPITNNATLSAYIAFFFVLWFTWFQTTLFDVRFARDSIFERCCKTIQFIVFIGLALVGYNFETLSGGKKNNPYFQILCWTLFMSRLGLAIQYLVTAFLATKMGQSSVKFPLILNGLVMLVASVIFASLVPVFSDPKASGLGAFITWYVVIALEAAATLIISVVWKKLSFRRTHIGERMSLLCMIIIGEGVIGTSKTVSKMLGKDVYVEGVFEIICIIIILVFIWMLNFDNLPKRVRGESRHPFWAAFQLPLQLSIVGVVEGCQQIALARYTGRKEIILVTDVYTACYDKRLQGAPLRDSLLSTITKLGLSTSKEAKDSYELVLGDIYKLGNTTNLCTGPPPTITDFVNSTTFSDLWANSLGGLFQSIGIELPFDPVRSPEAIAIDSWRVVYTYFWSAVLMLLVCLSMSMIMARGRAGFGRTFVSRAVRFFVSMVAVTLLTMGRSWQEFYYVYIWSPYILPTVVLMLFVVVIGDRITFWRQRRAQTVEKV